MNTDRIAKEVKNINEANKAYFAAKRNAQALAQKIERAILDSKTQTDGNWGLVGDMQEIERQLQHTLDMMTGQGEYAR